MRSIKLTTMFLLLLGACSGPQDRSPTVRTDEGAGASLPPSGPALPGEVPEVPRAQLEGVLGRGVGDFLARNVEVEPEQRAGAFAGWRIASFSTELPPWLDLRPGDVVTAINRLPLERPEDAQRVWEALQISSEVLIDLERNGTTFSIRIPIADEPAPPGPEPAAPPAPDEPEPE